MDKATIALIVSSLALLSVSQPPRPLDVYQRLDGWFWAIKDSDRIALFTLIVTALYLFFTIMIWRQMIRANKNAETAYKAGKEDTEESLRIASEGQADTRVAVKVAEEQLGAIVNVSRARLTIEGIETNATLSSSLPVEITVRILNAGHTPALEVQWSGVTVLKRKGSSTPFSISDATDNGPYSVGTIAAGTSRPAPVNTVEITEADAEDIFTDAIELWLHGTARYRHIFDPKLHRVDFRARFDYGRSTFVNITQNEVDE